jgi:tRNA pseudouridine55 synthase
MDFEQGEVICLDKPYRWTSFDLVNKVRYILRHVTGKKLKVGHAGTLDPLATGVMLICTGKATKKIDNYQAGIKEYIATLQLGATTPSFDLEHEIDHTYPFDHITRQAVDECLLRFMGTIEQIPPEYSAVKIDGKRAYEYARKGKDVVIKSKTLVIDEIEVLAFSLPVLKLRIVCSKGTYIRALARDIGQELNSGAHLIGLQRTRVGDFTMNEAQTIEDFEKKLRNSEPGGTI